MPELPEVETVRRGLEPALLGRVLADVEQRRLDLRWPLPERFAERLRGRRVERLRRRSKWILIDLDSDGGDHETWIVHLGMSGRMLIEPTAGASPTAGERDTIVAFAHTAGQQGKHDHVIVTTDRDVRITYNDARRFGAMDLWPTAKLDHHPHLATLGPEPLGNAFNAMCLQKRSRAGTARSRLLFWIRKPWLVWAISMSARRCSGRASTRHAWPVRSRTDGSKLLRTRLSRPCLKPSRPVAPACATIAKPTGNWATFNIPSRFMIARISLAALPGARRRSVESSSLAGQPSTVRSARDDSTRASGWLDCAPDSGMTQRDDPWPTPVSRSRRVSMSA